MTTTIWKFLLPSAVCTLAIPVDAEILSVAEQDGRICVWARCGPDAAVADRKIAAVNTGAPAPSPAYGRFIGTVQMRSGIVWHVFEDQL